MASSDMASVDKSRSWNFRPSSFMDPWFSDIHPLTTALQQSLSNSDTTATVVPTPTPVDSATKSHRSSLPITSGKVSKRKPRKSKRSEMTFIYADPANFRQMVQQVTGASFIDAAQLPQILKPEPQRPGGGRRCLDTSSAGTAPTYMTTQTVPEVDGGGWVGLAFNSISSFPTLESWNNAM